MVLSVELDLYAVRYLELLDFLFKIRWTETSSRRPAEISIKKIILVITSAC